MPFQIIRDDITKVKADMIVNTANPNVDIGAGVDAAIYKAAGQSQLLLARAQIGYLAPGNVALTDAFNLDARFIAHCSGPWWEGGNHGEKELLRNCYDKCLRLAVDNKCQSIAFPLMATGTYGFPKEVGMRIAIDAFEDFLKIHEIDISLVVYHDYHESVAGQLFDDVNTFVDGRFTFYDEFTESSADYSHSSFDDGFSCESYPSAPARADFASFSPLAPGTQSSAAPKAENKSGKKFLASRGRGKTLDDILKSIYTDSFEKHLKRLINKKGLKNSEVYTRANISKQYFSKLLKGTVKPSKEKILCLALGLQLNIDELEDFLKIAGYALSPVSQTDAVVEYFVRAGRYNVIEVNIVLFDYGLEPLTRGE